MTPHVILSLSAILGGGSLLLFGLFLFWGPLNFVVFKIGDFQKLGLDLVLSLLFFIQHSLMVRSSVKQQLRKVISPVYVSAVYSICSGIFLLLVVLLWQPSEKVLFRFGTAGSFAARMIFLLSAVGFWISSISLGYFDPLGIRQVRFHIKGKPFRELPFTISGAYRWVRHPLYFFIIVMIWSYPYLTIDRFLFNMIWTIWIIAGTIMEERDLSASFGEEYLEYQKKVPMLIPLRMPEKFSAFIR